MSNIFNNKDAIRNHTITFATTGSGLSSFGNKLTEKIKNEEYEVERDNLIKKQIKIKENYLLMFNNIEELYEEHYLIFEYAQNFLNHPIKDIETFKVMFFNIPQDLFGAGISYGFDDSVYRDDLFEFFEKSDYKSFKNFYQKYLGENNE
tara:strand:- start:10228 stop:10674 length:447 start_codon:yes stop_codon:yes gene_type:complete